MKGRIERGFLKVGDKRCACIECIEGVEVEKRLNGRMTVHFWYKPNGEVVHDTLTMDYDEKLYQTIKNIMEVRGKL